MSDTATDPRSSSLLRGAAQPASLPGAPDFLMVTFDSLRLDVAEEAFRRGEIPFLQSLLPGGWERRHTPGTFTYAAHAAFFAGFWPTPIGAVASGEWEETNDAAQRPFALQFIGSRTVGPRTLRLGGDNIVAGLRERGYRTICIGGVGFFNERNPLGSVFPRMFEESHWRPEFAVSEIHSTREQVRQACASLEPVPADQSVFLFLNVSATHAPTRIYLREGARESVGESVDTQRAALAYVDRQLPPLFRALRQRRRPGRAFLMSDHGTLFGEEGIHGHRVAHPAVWNVPYGECCWTGAEGEGP